ncbi:unnamed protein product [Pedinophyceae sp. YPF-701]|nr:unnamed protein product [Pedinophyceae sp. YPF-701]
MTVTVQPVVEGALSVKRGLFSFPRACHCRLRGGTVTCFKPPEPGAALGAPVFTLRLVGCDIRVLPDGFSVRQPSGTRFTFRTPQPRTRLAWLRALAKEHGVYRKVADWFEVGPVLGEGAACVVREARCLLTGGKFAVKQRIDGKSCASSRAIHNELTVLQYVGASPHPAVPRLVDYFFDRHGDISLVLDLMAGGELFASLVRKDRYTEAEARAAFVQVLRGIDHLHAMGVVHRDIKPENLMFESDDETNLRIIDFDLARCDFRDEWRGDTPCGTLSYMAPEVIAHQVYDKSIDMWSLGCVLYILLCGRKPFGGTTEEHRKANITRAKVPFPDDLWGRVSPEAKDLVSRLLRKDPRERLTARQALEHPWILGLERCAAPGLSAASAPLRTPAGLRAAISQQDLAALQHGDRQSRGHVTALRNLHGSMLDDEHAMRTEALRHGMAEGGHKVSGVGSSGHSSRNAPPWARFNTAGPSNASSIPDAAAAQASATAPAQQQHPSPFLDSASELDAHGLLALRGDPVFSPMGQSRPADAPGDAAPAPAPAPVRPPLPTGCASGRSPAPPAGGQAVHRLANSSVMHDLEQGEVRVPEPPPPPHVVRSINVLESVTHGSVAGGSCVLMDSAASRSRVSLRTSSDVGVSSRERRRAGVLDSWAGSQASGAGERRGHVASSGGALGAAHTDRPPAIVDADGARRGSISALRVQLDLGCTLATRGSLDDRHRRSPASSVRELEVIPSGAVLL